MRQGATIRPAPCWTTSRSGWWISMNMSWRGTILCSGSTDQQAPERQPSPKRLLSLLPTRISSLLSISDTRTQTRLSKPSQVRFIFPKLIIIDGLERMQRQPSTSSQCHLTLRKKKTQPAIDIPCHSARINSCHVVQQEQTIHSHLTLNYTYQPLAEDGICLFFFDLTIPYYLYVVLSILWTFSVKSKWN